MAKRKLSPSQRLSIRKELSDLLGTAKTKAEALRVVAKKYGISTITAGWYAKTLKSTTGASTRKPGNRSSRQGARRDGRSQVDVASNGRRSVSGVVEKAVAAVQSIAEKAFTRARLAKELIPQWQVFVRKEHSLRNTERQVRRELKVVARKARILHQKIKSLTT